MCLIIITWNTTFPSITIQKQFLCQFSLLLASTEWHTFFRLHIKTKPTTLPRIQFSVFSPPSQGRKKGMYLARPKIPYPPSATNSTFIITLNNLPKLVHWFNSRERERDVQFHRETNTFQKVLWKTVSGIYNYIDKVKIIIFGTNIWTFTIFSPLLIIMM